MINGLPTQPEEKRYLIAGCGYVGTQLAKVLLQSGAAAVYALRRRNAPAHASDGVQWLAADMVHGDLSALPRDLAAVFYCASPGGSTPGAYKDIYLRGLGRILEHVERYALPGARLILTSSTSVYGQSNGEWVDEGSPTQPTAETSQLILAGEALLRPQDIAVRLAGIYGPGRTSMIDGIRNQTLSFNVQTSTYTNRIHQVDAARILAFAAALAWPAQIYNGVDSVSATRFEVAAWLAQKLGKELRLTPEGEGMTTLRGNKRCSNQRLLAAGYHFLYPSYREGYGALIDGERI